MRPAVSVSTSSAFTPTREQYQVAGSPLPPRSPTLPPGQIVTFAPSMTYTLTPAPSATWSEWFKLYRTREWLDYLLTLTPTSTFIPTRTPGKENCCFVILTGAPGAPGAPGATGLPGATPVPLPLPPPVYIIVTATYAPTVAPPTVPVVTSTYTPTLSPSPAPTDTLVYTDTPEPTIEPSLTDTPPA